MYMYLCDCTFEVLGVFFSLEMGYLLLWFDYYRNFFYCYKCILSFQRLENESFVR